MPKSILSTCRAAVTATVGILFATLATQAATVIWSGASGTDTNWSTSANWLGGIAPASADDVKFFNLGANANATAGVPNNFVDPAFAGTIASLQFGQTNAAHTISISNGLALNITGTGGLVVGTAGDSVAVATTNNAAVKGVSGATLMLNNTAAKMVLNQGATTANGNRAILDLSGLDNFTANSYALGIGSVHFQYAVAQRNSGILYLARTNVLTFALTDTLANYSTLGNRTNAIEVAYVGAGNNASVQSIIYLGQTNAIYVDSLGIGRSKASTSSAATLTFNPAFSNPSAYIRGVGGANSRVTWWAAGDMADSASSAQQSVGTNDFSLGTVDALVDTMSLGRDCSPQHTASGNNIGVLTFAAGTINVNNLIVGNQILGPNTSFSGNIGIVNVKNSATLVVNNALTLGRTTVTYVGGSASGGGTNALKTQGFLNLRNGGIALVNSLAVGGSSSNCVVTLSNATLVVSNGIASPSKGLTVLTATNSLLRLFVANPAITNIFTTNLVSAGVTNLIGLDSVAVFSSYPQQVTLLKYVNQVGLGVTNFGLTNIPASAPGAYLSNNIANSSLDLVLPSDPRPVITASPASYSGNPGDNVMFSVGVSPSSVTPLTYKWYLGTTLLSDGVTANGSTISGSSTATLSLNGAQPGDNGNYTVVISNAYGSVTNSPAAVLTISAGCVSPSLTGPINTTVIQGNNATFSSTAAGNPVPGLQWYRNGTAINGATGSSYTLNNVQYPADDGAVFSLVASNACGMATNSATLTVIVPPSISAQPVSLVVTSTQSATFSVMASGVPLPAYQWFFGATPIAGATNASYSIASSAAANIGAYKVVLNNSAGTLTSSNATLIVNSTMSATALSPANGAAGVCYDTPLSVTFSVPPSLRGGAGVGAIRIYNVTNSVTPVDTIDLSLGSPQVRGIGGDSFNSYPVIITGNAAAIYPHSGVMRSNATYYVTIDDGVFADASGAYFAGITATNVWSFSTKIGGPANVTNLVIAADGSGDFVTVQGAVDSVPANNTTPTILNIRNGFYTEIVDVKSKNNLDFRGQSRNGTFIGYANNNNLNTSGAPLRAMFVLNGNDCSFETITLTNTTPSGGSQAEAIDVEGTRASFVNMELDSYQDTFLVHSAGKLVYFQDSLIQGQTDFNWGYGTVYYTNCELRCLLSGGHVTQPRSPTGTNGFGFINCRITQGYAGTNAFDLGRTISTPTSPSEVLFYNCLMADVVPGYASDAGVNMADYGCSNLTATVLKSSLLYSTHSPSTDPYVIAVQTAPTWLYGWQPTLAPNILANPVNQTVTAGQSASFTVSATGVPLTYQWQHAGTNLPGATSATLNITSATADEAGSYACIATTPTGSATTTSATLTVNPIAVTVTPNGATKVYGTMDPSLTYTYNPVLLMGDSFTGALSRTSGQNVGSYAIIQGTLALNANYSITFITTSNLVITPASLSITANDASKVIGATLNFAGTEFAASGLLGSDNVTSVILTSGGAGASAGTGTYPIVPSAATGSGLSNYNLNYQNGTLTVTGNPNSSFTGVVANSNGSVTLTFSGGNGVTYRIQATDNLVNPTWTDIATNTMSGGSSSYTDTNTRAVQRFYRLVGR